MECPNFKFLTLEGNLDDIEIRKIKNIISQIKKILIPLGYSFDSYHFSSPDVFSISKNNYFYSILIYDFLRELGGKKYLKKWLLRATAQINNRTSNHHLNIYKDNPDAQAIIEAFKVLPI